MPLVPRLCLGMPNYEAPPRTMLEAEPPEPALPGRTLGARDKKRLKSNHFKAPHGKPFSYFNFMLHFGIEKWDLVVPKWTLLHPRFYLLAADGRG